MADVPLLVEVALHKPLHVGHAPQALVTAEDVDVDRRAVVIGIELSLELRQRLRFHESSGPIRITQLIGDSVDARIDHGQRPQHVVE